MKGSSDKNHPFLCIIASGMELTWLFAIFILIMDLLKMPLLIMPQVIIIFILSALLTLYTRKKGYKYIYRLVMHCILISFFIFHSLDMVSKYFSGNVNQTIIETLLNGPNTFWEGLNWVIASMIIIIFHAGGICLARRELSYRNIAARFDLGITFFILTLIVAGAAGLPSPAIMALIYAFFIFGLPAIAIARYQQSDRKIKFLNRHRRSAPIIVFSAFTLITGSGIALLFYPHLQQAASAGQNFMVYYGRPVADLFARIIVFLYSRRPLINNPQTNGINGQNNLDTISPGSEQAGLPEQLLFWILMAIVAAAVIFIIIFIARIFINWLSSDPKNSQSSHEVPPIKQFFKFLQKALSILWLFGTSLVNFLNNQGNRKNERDPAYMFLKLAAWGAKSGRPRIEIETPLEYAVSLQKKFPTLEQDISYIANIINREIYGGVVPGTGEKERLNQSWRKLHHPGFWPARFKSRLLG